MYALTLELQTLFPPPLSYTVSAIPPKRDEMWYTKLNVILADFSTVLDASCFFGYSNLVV